jgi:hypothetical protein
MIFYTTNLTKTELRSDLLPWDFQPSEVLTAQLRRDKAERQRFYRNPATQHYFYSLTEGANPNMRPSKDNPPKAQHGFCPDFDLPIPEPRVMETIAAMKIKPTWFERSLGGNVRLLWLFSKPLQIENYDFCCFILKEALKWLGLGMLPGLDEGAFTDPSRLLCNGCNWQKVGEPIPENELQAFFVKCGKDFRFKPGEGNSIPLDVIEKAIVERFPGFSWPVDFVVDSQGPTFWVPESTSPMSAIVKPDGMFTFSDHAGKPFWPWSDILGAEFVKNFSTQILANATKEIYWDSKRFWRQINNSYVSLDSPELNNYFKVTCRLSNKPGNDGHSPVDLALDHIYNNGRIAGAAPYMFRPHGLIDYQGQKVLNVYKRKVMQPAEDFTPWGAEGTFPFLSRHFDALFDPGHQKWHFLAWWRAFYLSGLTMTPMPGQNAFLMGGVNVGKTLTSRAIVGRSVGGFADASAHLINGGGGFNSELMEVPLWCVDDETMGESSQSQTNFQAMMKKTSANQQFQYNKKFEVGMTVDWMGRVICTTNLDYISSRALGPMDNGSADKTCVFRCASHGKIVFPNRHELAAIIERELPYLLRWMISGFKPDEHGVQTDVRYGYAVYHEPSLLDQAQQGSKSAPFKELLFEALTEYFREHKEDRQWKGSLTQLVRMLHTNPLNDSVLRSLRLEQTNRYIEMIQRENCIRCSVETGPLKTRIWVFDRFDTVPVPELPPASTAPSTFVTPAINIFFK